MSLHWFCPHFKEYQREKTSTYILKPCLEIGQSFEESLREGKLVKSLEIFEWIINFMIIKFGFLTMWKIMQFSKEDGIHLGR